MFQQECFMPPPPLHKGENRPRAATGPKGGPQQLPIADVRAISMTTRAGLGDGVLLYRSA